MTNVYLGCISLKLDRNSIFCMTNTDKLPENYRWNRNIKKNLEMRNQSLAVVLCCHIFVLAKFGLVLYKFEVY